MKIIIDNKSRLDDRDAVQFVARALILDREFVNKKGEFGCSITFKYEKIKVGVPTFRAEDELFFYVLDEVQHERTKR